MLKDTIKFQDFMFFNMKLQWSRHCFLRLHKEKKNSRLEVIEA